ncbi:hypothetical protein, partial [Hymenobacter fastidiosus]|uniref:hypothetical protein n=1 Tax=Hymenobacter fastidiosus TaxID=486264 RepID=UPI0031F01BFF
SKRRMPASNSLNYTRPNKVSRPVARIFFTISIRTGTEKLVRTSTDKKRPGRSIAPAGPGKKERSRMVVRQKAEAV